MRRFIVLLSLALATACANEPEKPTIADSQEIYLSCKEKADSQYKNVGGGSEGETSKDLQQLYRVNLKHGTIYVWSDEDGKFVDTCTKDIGCKVKVSDTEISSETIPPEWSGDDQSVTRNGWLKIGRTTGMISSYQSLVLPSSLKTYIVRSSGACKLSGPPQKKF